MWKVLSYAPIVCCTSLHLKIVVGRWVHLTFFSAWFYEHPYCTDDNIWLFLLLLTNIQIYRFG